MATMIGTEGPDDITETSEPDTINLLGGDDILRVVNPPRGFVGSTGEEFLGGDGFDRMLL
jgi:hypothetical protein